MHSSMMLLGIGFLFAGGAKLSDPGAAVALFEGWGLARPALVPVAAWIEALLGLLLLNAPTRRVAAAALAVWMLPWIVLQLGAGAFPMVSASVAVLVLGGGFAWTSEQAFVPRQNAIRPPLLRTPPTSTGKILHGVAALVGISFLIRWVVGGTVFWTALPALAWLHARHPQARERSTLEAVNLYLLVLGLGVSGVWGFVGHTFMAQTVGESVGWAPSPFQSELAFYHLGIGVAGLACWWLRDHFWLAVAVIVSVFLYGAGWVHLLDFLETGNRAPTNWGPGVLFGNLLVPTALLVLGVLRARHRSGAGREAVSVSWSG